MNAAWAVFKREVRSYFSSPLAYAAIAVFVAVQGVLFLLAISAYMNRLSRAASNPGIQLPPVEALVRDLLGSDIVWALFLIVPLLTMRLLAEERRQHTAELLLTAPMTTRSLVLGKFLGSVFVLVIMLVLSLWMPFVMHLWGGCDPAVIWTGYAGAFLYGAFLLALGLLASSLTESVVLAAFLSLLLVTIVNVAGEMTVEIPYIGVALEQFTPVRNLAKIARGVLDSQPVIYFVSMTLFVLDLTARVVDSQRWR